MKNYKYEATFERIPMEAVGTVEAESIEDARRIVFGMCGDWRTESDHGFSAGCPVGVVIVEE